MSCDICDRGACCPGFHSQQEQDRYEKVIELFDKARALRDEIRRAEEDVGDIGDEVEETNPDEVDQE